MHNILYYVIGFILIVVVLMVIDCNEYKKNEGEEKIKEDFYYGRYRYPYYSRYPFYSSGYDYPYYDYTPWYSYMYPSYWWY